MPLDVNDPEFKAALKAAIDEATAPLIAKRDELLGELKKARRNSEISPEDYQKLSDQVDELQGKLTEATKASKTALSEADKFKKLYESESANTAKNLIESSLTNALVDAKVDPKFMKAVKALIGRDAKVEANGDERVAKIGDKALGDYIKEWASSEEAAHYIAAPANSGGGGAGGGVGGKPDLSKLPPAERMTAARAAAKP